MVARWFWEPGAQFESDIFDIRRFESCHPYKLKRMNGIYFGILIIYLTGKALLWMGVYEQITSKNKKGELNKRLFCALIMTPFLWPIILIIGLSKDFYLFWKNLPDDKEETE